MKKLLLALAPAIAIALALAAPQSAFADVANGSFETGTNPGAFQTLNAGNTNITSWTIDSGSVDYIGTYWQASNGSRSIDLSGNGPGTLSTTLPTIPGATYEVSFDLAGNPDGGPTIKTLNVAAAGHSSSFSFDITGKSTGAMGWTTKSFTFVAMSSTTTLSFVSTTSGPWGPALDNVVVDLIRSPSGSERIRVNTGGAAGAVAAAAGQQARENRAAAAAAAAPPAAVSPPSTGTGIQPPNTGDAGLLVRESGSTQALPLLLAGALSTIGLVAGLARLRRRMTRRA